MLRKILLSGFLVVAAAQAEAGTILAPVAGTINAGGPGSGTLTETFNQAGLSTGYVSGVTDFDTYLSTNPQHTASFFGFEWFSNNPTTSASVTYDFGGIVKLASLALWNEESSGIGTLSLFSSLDNVTFTALALGLAPTDNPLQPPFTYGADRFNFTATDLRYVRFDMSDCPQPNPGSFSACAIGEVAFNQVTAVPAPAAAGLFGLGLLGLGLLRRRTA